MFYKEASELNIVHENEDSIWCFNAYFNNRSILETSV